MTTLKEEIFFPGPPGVQFKYEVYLSIFFRIFIVFHIIIDGRISTIDNLICIESSERKLILVTTDFVHYISVETVQVQYFFKVKNSSSVALESTSINFIFFRTYYLFNQFIKKNSTGKLCNRKYYIPPAEDDNSNCER